MRKLLTLDVLITTSIAASAEQPARRREADRPGEIRAAAAKLGRGINLGNALEAPKEGEWGVQLKAEYFPAIKKAGFATVRLPVRWSAHAQKEAPYTIDAKFAERVDWAVDQALANGLNIIVNVHSATCLGINRRQCERGNRIEPATEMAAIALSAGITSGTSCHHLSRVDPDLHEVIAAWQTSPANVRRVILNLIDMHQARKVLDRVR